MVVAVRHIASEVVDAGCQDGEVVGYVLVKGSATSPLPFTTNVFMAAMVRLRGPYAHF